MSQATHGTLERIEQYVKKQDDIRIALIIGSQARSVIPADEWSDIDIVMVATRPERYLDGASWLDELGLKPMVTLVEATARGGEKERRVLFQNGVDVDFSVIPLSHLEPRAREGRGPEEIMEVIWRGYRSIKDADNVVPQVLGNQPRFAEEHVGRSQVLLEEEYHQAVSDFLYHLVWAARKLRRGELWVATYSCNRWMKLLLVQMIEWCMHAKRGDEYDTWHEGRFLENWADESIVNKLRSTFAHYDYSDVKSALFSTTDLYTQLARNVAERLGFQYPEQSEQFAREQAGRALHDESSLGYDSSRNR